jgi:antitoxin component YwqK of YwqJK toxin-antitoxin module
MNRLKILILLIVFPLLSIECVGQNVEYQRLSESLIKIDGDTLHKINDTLYQKFFLSGKVEYEGKIINDKKEGKWITYYEDGSLCKEIYYKNGIKNGKYIWYFKNGNKVQEVDLVDGKKHGEEKYWNEDGSLNSVTKYENDEKIEIRVYKPNYINTTDTTAYDGDVIWRKQ